MSTAVVGETVYLGGPRETTLKFNYDDPIDVRRAKTYEATMSRYLFTNQSSQNIHITSKVSSFHILLVPGTFVKVEVEEPHAHVKGDPVEAATFEDSEGFHVTFKDIKPVWGDASSVWGGEKL